MTNIHVKDEIKLSWANELLLHKKLNPNSLRNGNLFSTIGVLCDLAVKYKIGRWDDDFYCEHGPDADYCYTIGVPPSVVSWATGIKYNPYEKYFIGVTPTENGDVFFQTDDQYVPTKYKRQPCFIEIESYNKSGVSSRFMSTFIQYNSVIIRDLESYIYEKP